MPEPQPPEWVKDAVFYQIFPDRFASSLRVAKPARLEAWDAPPTAHGFKGGDLLGVSEHLDYLVDLGITAIYLNPIFQSAANHRYHTHDYYRVDPLLGGDAAFRTLLSEVHRRGMRVVLDGVFNHASRGFLQFNHILENGPQSPYVDWFTIKGYPLHAYDTDAPPNYEAWTGLRALPKFRGDTPAVREFLLSVGEHWVREGIDGWRLDVAEECGPDFWREFRNRVRAVNPDAYIVAEIWHEAQSWLQGDHFCATTNYPVAINLLSYLSRETLDLELAHEVWGYVGLVTKDLSAFASEVDRILALYPDSVNEAQLTPLDSHDTPRFLTLARGDESALRLAVLFQMTTPGAPCIYYGDEIGMEGKQDPDCRRAFPWDPARWNQSLRAYVKRCIALRRAHPALRRGAFRRLHAAADVYAFARTLGDESVVVILNASRQSRSPDIDVRTVLPDGAALVNLWSSERLTVAGGRLTGFTMAPRIGYVLTAMSA